MAGVLAAVAARTVIRAGMTGVVGGGVIHCGVIRVIPVIHRRTVHRSVIHPAVVHTTEHIPPRGI
ncbi:hypothetical protein GCM10009551_062320 [Nocardiopsis tropica]